MTAYKVDLIHSVKGGLLEGPRFHPTLGLVYADAAHGGVYSLIEGSDPNLLIPFRKGIGGLVLHAHGGAVITGRNVAHKTFTGGDATSQTFVLLDRDVAAGRVGFNDLTTDAAGRLYVGSLGFVAMEEAIDGHAAGPPGSLYVIDTDGRIASLADDVELSNGMAFSVNGNRLYQCDSGRKVVFAYDLDPETREVRQRSIFAVLDHGVPDGIAVSADDTVWVALAHAGMIMALSKAGKLTGQIELPVPMVTSLCFGGPDLGTMYVVTGSEGSDPELGACIYTVVVDVPGIAIPEARTPLRTNTGVDDNTDFATGNN